MLDSSPVALPRAPPQPTEANPLKRSSSTASLPTPPRTQRKRRIRTNGRGRGSDSEKAGSKPSSDDEGAPVKRRRLEKVAEDEEDFDDEDAFWTDKKSATKPVEPKDGSNRAAFLNRTSLSPPGSPVPLLERRRQRAQSTSSSLASPPPSFRRPKGAKVKQAVVTCPSPPPTALPSTPKAKFPPPIRDSPDNPFLDSDDDEDVDEESVKAASTAAADTEKPMVTFVFRGVRKQFPNPYYDPVKKGPVSPPPNSLLPPDHIDFSPDTRCPPKVLFPKTKKPKAVSAATPKAAATTSQLLADESGNESDDDELGATFKPTKLFAAELA